MEIDERKVCMNCRYYVEYCIKTERPYLQKLCCGSCINSKVKIGAAKKYINCSGGCEQWEPFSVQKSKRRENIFKALIKMKEQLDEIALILKDDQEERR